MNQEDQNVCRVCGEGSVKLITVHNEPESSDIQLYECDSCGSEYADHELAKKNIDHHHQAALDRISGGWEAVYPTDGKGLITQVQENFYENH